MQRRQGPQGSNSSLFSIYEALPLQVKTATDLTPSFSIKRKDSRNDSAYSNSPNDSPTFGKAYSLNLFATDFKVGSQSSAKSTFTATASAASPRVKIQHLKERFIPHSWGNAPRTLQNIPEDSVPSLTSPKELTDIPAGSTKPLPPPPCMHPIDSYSGSFAYSLLSEHSASTKYATSTLVNEERDEADDTSSMMSGSVQSFKSPVQRKTTQRLNMQTVSNNPKSKPSELENLVRPLSASDTDSVGNSSVACSSRDSVSVCSTTSDETSIAKDLPDAPKKKVHWGGIDFGRLEYVEELEPPPKFSRSKHFLRIYRKLL